MKILAVILLIILLIVCTYFILSPNTPYKDIPASDLKQYEDNALIPSSEKEGISPGGNIKAHVYRVVDGDTIDVKYKSKEYKVRLLDIDTPESVKEGVKVQPFAEEASNETRKIVLGKDVKLIFEKGLRDKYDRLLAHVVTSDGIYLNALLVGEGYARVEFVTPNTMYENYFENLQEKAVKAKTGLWGLPADKQPFVKDSDGKYIPRYYVEDNAA